MSSTIWPLTLGIGASAALLSSFIDPKLRKLTFGSLNNDWLANEASYDHVDGDNQTIVCKNGTKFKIFKVKGLSFDTKELEEENNLLHQRESLLNIAGSLGLTLRFYCIKKNIDSSIEAEYPTQNLNEIGKAEIENFKKAYEVSYYIAAESQRKRNILEFEDRLHSILVDYSPKTLSLNPNKNEHCQLMSFLNYLMCGDYNSLVKPISKNISRNIQACNLEVSKEGIVKSSNPEENYFKIIQVQYWENSVTGALINNICNVNAELEIFQYVESINKLTHIQALNRQVKEASSIRNNQAEAEEADAMSALMSEGSQRFITQFQIMVKGDNLRKVNKTIKEITASIEREVKSYIILTSEIGFAWFNRMPTKNNTIRNLKLTDQNIAAIWPFHYSPTGLSKSYWCDKPIRTFKTPSGQAYNFQFQSSQASKALGNFIVFAPSGVGKSTLMMHLLGGATKIEKFKSFILDSKEGARYMIESFGGNYQSYDQLSLNPLDIKNISKSEEGYIAKIIKTMIGNIDFENTEEDVDEVINHIVKTISNSSTIKTFNDIYEGSFPPRSKLKRAFSKWVKSKKGNEGLYSHILNANRDVLASFFKKSFMVGINMNEALDDEELAPVIVMHIANAIERVAKSGDLKGFAIFIDEAANLLRNKTFKINAKQMYREYRKLGGAVGMAFQDPKALFESGVADAVIENTSCFFFFPNPQGNIRAYEPFNLNQEQLNFIFQGAKGSRKVLLIKRDASTGFEESTILDVDLSILGSALRFYKSGPEEVRLLEELKVLHGNDWHKHI